ncbi:probable LRR receptor-like serine/threonine-protein kinase At1g53440 isoform X2 [Cornus florida]|uniref:probable LRR receptor-like serine/threonine-protein kinase At1g53440 isoform X2 n=1 Tax=Cornus florida TaxID=4283 RepID=UPI002896ABD1|nr:probable LRR receptor-like serine/threonine-protein kinase At1g53440 isoform X2 [Cornus florida]
MEGIGVAEQMESLFNSRTNFRKICTSLLFLSLFLNCFTEFTSAAQLLPLEEVQALEDISRKLHIKHLNSINRTFCSKGNFSKVVEEDMILINISCKCNNTICHITDILLKGQNLTGEIPAEFAKLSSLQNIDLTRNCINGTIPTFLAQLRLTNLSLSGNRISGSIPNEIGDIATLEWLIVENTQIGGPLPWKLGNLSRLTRLLLSANNFSGTLPDTYSNLKNLTDFRIDGSKLSGKIPDWIGNWTSITRLDMQGTSLEGPLPSTISLLKNLTELRISDLKGSISRFPDLRNMKNLKHLILRNCLINDSIPDYIGELHKLKTIDLSFNMLTGQIPTSFGNLKNLTYMFLSNNSLTGNIPNWIIDRDKRNVDVSYNNFTEPPTDFVCNQLPKANLASSNPSNMESNSNAWCLKKDLPCSNNRQYYSLFINCGGSKTTFDGNEYEEDSAMDGPSYYFVSPEKKWAYSSTGVFVGNEKKDYIAKNSSSFKLIDENEIYGTARLAPTSLKYYGLCLRKGSYKVHLHFAEIMFSDDQTFSSLGKRIFDVSIQGKPLLKDFNIMEEAEGPGKNITKVHDVNVSGSTLEIHLYWSGKGTNAIPGRGVYGPLISAISVTPNFDPDTGLSVGAIVGIVAASCVVLVLILLLLRIKGYLGGKDLEDTELRGLDLQTGYFTLRQIKAATRNFDPANKIGEGGFGPVYKGVLSDGAVIAVKQLSSKSKQGNREFINEIGMISALQHPNLVRLYGCCIEGNQLLLIYEYLENNNLARALFGSEEHQLNLNWPARKKICLGIARGLAYLHEESRLKIVHRDIKATNVLLDKDLNAKISDFGLAKLDEEENTHISTRIAGTIGYMAPEYAMRGYLTDKADIYNFGVVLLEIVSGKSNTSYRPREESVYLLDWAYVLQEQGNLLELVDPRIGSNYSKEEAMRMLNLSLLCANLSPTLRPSMSSVVSMLEGNSPVQAPIVKCSSLNEDLRFKAFEKRSQDTQTPVSTFSQDSQMRGSMSIDGSWIASSNSIKSKNEDAEHSSSSKLFSDLYDINLD